MGQFHSPPSQGPNVPLSAVTSVAAGPAKVRDGKGASLCLPLAWGSTELEQNSPRRTRPQGGPRFSHRPIYKPAVIKSDIPVFWKIWPSLLERDIIWSPLQPPPSHYPLVTAGAIINRKLLPEGSTHCRGTHLTPWGLHSGLGTPVLPLSSLPTSSTSHIGLSRP